MSEAELISKLTAGRVGNESSNAGQSNNIDHSQEMDIDILQVSF